MRLRNAASTSCSIKPWISAGDSDSEIERTLRQGLDQIGAILTERVPVFGEQEPVSDGSRELGVVENVDHRVGLRKSGDTVAAPDHVHLR
jgi:hypothetical protein